MEKRFQSGCDEYEEYTFLTQTKESPVTSFSEFNLSSEVLKAIEEMGFTAPTPIQVQALPMLLGESTDFLGLAATGTGKTAAFGIPLIEKLDPSLKAVQSLILCPTRELAMQVAGQIELLGKYKGINTLAIYGGASYDEQIRGLKRGPQVVVGTPGRVIDHLERGRLNLEGITALILDEADEMISMGFKDDLETILGSVPKETCNTWFFSATMDKTISKVVSSYLRDPKQVQINRKEMLSSTIEQLYYTVKESDKPEILCKLIESAEEFYGLVFCQTKQLVTELSTYLIERGYRVDNLHGDKDQKSRERTMQAFRDRKVQILICTDVAARGLDVKDITHVINYSLPRELDNYVHRIGRTARSGKTGIAMNLVTASHRRLLFQIENLTKSRMTEGKIPTRKDLGLKKVAKILPSFSEQPNFNRAQEVMGEDWKNVVSNMTTEEVAARFLAMMMPDLFNEKDKPTRLASQSNDDFDRDRSDRSGGGRRDRSFGGRGGSRGGRFDGERSGGRFGDRDRGPRSERFDRGGERDGGDRFASDRGGERFRDRFERSRPFEADRGERSEKPFRKSFRDEKSDSRAPFAGRRERRSEEGFPESHFGGGRTRSGEGFGEGKPREDRGFRGSSRRGRDERPSSSRFSKKNDSAF